MKTVEEFENLVQEAFAIRDEIDEIEGVIEDKNAKLSKIQAEIQGILEETGRDSYRSSKGLISVVNNFSVKTPKDPLSKERFFTYLKEKDQFDALITVNSQTLNSWYRQELEAAVAGGNSDFSVPGIEEPKLYKKISMRRSK